MRGLAQADLDPAELGRVQRELGLDLPAVLEEAKHGADVVGADRQRRGVRGCEGLGGHGGRGRRRDRRRVDRGLLGGGRLGDGGGVVVAGRRGCRSGLVGAGGGRGERSGLAVSRRHTLAI